MPKILISSCLVGEEVRYDGESRPSPAVNEYLVGRVELVTVCPEVELGMPVPREPIDLHGDPRSPRLLGAETGEDWTERMTAWARARVAALLDQGIAGAVLKARSPSCGVGTARIAPGKGDAAVPGHGMFTRALREAAPELPVVEDEDLQNAAAAEAFLARVRAYASRS